MNKIRSSGFSLLMVLGTSAIAAVILTGTLRMLSTQMTANRKVAGSAAVTDFSLGLNNFFGGARCSSVQADAVAINPSAIAFASMGAGAKIVKGAGCTDPGGYCLKVDKLAFPSGSEVFSTDPLSPVNTGIAPYKIKAATFTALGGDTSQLYPFKLTVTFDGPPPPVRPLVKFIAVNTDASLKVMGACESTGAVASTVASGSLCGSVFWEVNVGGGTPCGNIHNWSKCQGNQLMTTCGTGTCPTGYTFTMTAYSWQKNGGYVARYHQGSCAKD
jgi:hypothetical protein